MRPTTVAFLVALAAIGAIPAGAAPLEYPVLVADFHPGTRPLAVDPGRLTPLGDRLYFSGFDPRHGYEPWVSDGSEAGTRLLADLCPGPCSSFPNAFRLLGDHLVVAAPGASGVYAIDAAGQSEQLFYDDRSNFFGVAQLGGLVYFTAIESEGGALVGTFHTDGTQAGTARADELCAAPPCVLNYFAEADDALYYVTGGQLFRKTAAGAPVALAPLTRFEHLTRLAAGLFVFVGCAETDGCQAFATDGTPAGTRQLTSPPAVVDGPMLAWRGRVYFPLDSDTVASTDGTAAGTRAEPAFEGGDPELLAADDQHLFYFSDSAPFRDLRAVDAGGAGSLPLQRSPHGIEAIGLVGGHLYFSYLDDQQRRFLAISGGTPATTLQLDQIARANRGALFGGFLYFGLESYFESRGALLYRTDGSNTGLAEVSLGETPRGSYPLSYPVGGSLLAVNGSQDVYRIDPASLAVSHLAAYPVWSEYAAGRDYLFLRTDDFLGKSLASVGAAGGLHWLAEGVGSMGIAGDGHLFFTEWSLGQKLWESDGTLFGTREIFDLQPGWDACLHNGCVELPRAITPIGDRVFFVAGGEAPGSEALWAWQRGAGFPTRLKDVPEGTFFFPVPPGRVVFVLPQETGHQHLWVSDGTAAGTRKFASLPPIYQLDLMAAAGGRLYFTVAYDGASALGATDPGLETTEVLLYTPETRIRELVASGDRVYFTGTRTRDSEPELGLSGGTVETSRWLDLTGGFRGSRPENLTPSGDGGIFFASTAGGDGLEPWISDGTPEGSRQLADVAPGPESSAPSHFARAGERLFFAAEGDGSGRELWALDLGVLAACPEDRLCLRGDRFEVTATATADGEAFAGRRALADDGSGVFTFFSPDNWELLVKVLDGCALNQTFWVYAAAASDVDFTIAVRDRWTGESRTYGSSGVAQPILDAQAFATCGAVPLAARFGPPPPAPAASICGADPQALCLGELGRYRLKLDWQTATGAGPATPVPFGSADSGLFSFFSPDNWELMVKLLDGCALNGRRWVFAAGTTDVGWTLTVEDQLGGATKVYRNTLGQPSITVTDTGAFGCP